MSKERLLELIRNIEFKCRSGCTNVNGCNICRYEQIADKILADGWIRPPLKIGQELWDIHYNKPRKWEVVYLGYNGKEWHINIHWWKDRHNFKTLSITYPFMGKMWYLTREEAEAKLKEGAE